MKTVFATLFLLTLCACTVASPPASEPLRVVDAWARETPPQARVAGGFLTIDNPGQQPDRLLSVESRAAARVEIHEVSEVQGVARMREIVDGLAVPARGKTILEPGGYHLMFIEPQMSFQVPATLVFENAGRQEVQFQVRPLIDAGPADHSHH